MNGTYYVYDGDELVAVSPNVITDQGRAAVLRFLAGETNTLGNHMAFGIGESVPSVTDLSLDFEYHRSEIDLVQSQIANNKIVMRGVIPDEKAFFVHEIGIYVNDDKIDTGSPNNVITTFDGRDEAIWTRFDGTDTSEIGFEYAGGRTGATSFQLDVPPDQVWTLTRAGAFGAFEDVQPTDQFALAYETLSGAATQIEVRFRLDENNYKSYSFAPATGFNVQRWPKLDFVDVGVSEWDDMRSLQVIVTAGPTGANVIFEGMRFDTVTDNERPVLVSRTLIPVPVEKRNTSELQIEYVLDIGFSVNGV